MKMKRNLSMALLAMSVAGTLYAAPYQANGIKVGSASSTNAVVWTRLTSVESPDAISQTTAAPGSTGEVKVIWWPDGDESSAVASAWEAVDSASDYTHQVSLSGLTPGTRYRVKSESRPLGGGSVTSTVNGQFKTAPAADVITPVLATIVTGQGIGTVDSYTNGHKAYLEMAQLQPDFFVHTGDVLYYDKNYTDKGDPINYQELSKNTTQARQRWNRMFSYSWNQDFSANVGCYFIKDDHDTLKNDCWPGQTYGSLTFAEGVALFKEQTPSGPLPYQTVRWGKDLQIWLLEGRDYRSANTDPDGPAKTILGTTQKTWLKNTLLASDATFKLVIAPGPFVGPDKPGKTDNHSNAAFQTEGDELRNFFVGIGNVFVVCGDRHWQYASVDPVTELREYCCGPINLEHDFGGNPGYDPNYHSFFAARGGYLSVLVNRQEGLPQVTFRYHDIDDTDSETGSARIAYEETLRQAGFGLITLTQDHVEGTVAIKAMTRYGYYYHVETSSNLTDWSEAQINIDPRGSLLTYADTLDDRDKAFYRIVETGSPRSMVPHTTASQGEIFSADSFNRADFVMDLVFTTPAVINTTTDMLLVEVGGSTKGTAVALVDGKLIISAGEGGASIVTYTGAVPLPANTSHSLRITALCEGAAGADSFEASLWTEGDPSASLIVQESGLTLEGFSGTDGGGLGVINAGYFNSGLTVPTASPPDSTIQSFSAYDPDSATAEAPLPSQPEP